MDTVNEALRLLKRQAELEATMHDAGGIRISEEQELYVVRQRLARYADASTAVIQAALALRKPVSHLSATDVETWARRDAVA
jgi:hypothetical protein